MNVSNCTICNKSVVALGSRVAKFCSIEHKAEWQTYQLGPNNPKFTEGPREKTCHYCMQVYRWRSPRPYSTFLSSKFCSKTCADKGGKRYYGEDNWRFNPNKESRSRKQSSWSKAVMQRDDYTCQSCGKRGGNLHADHIRPWKDYPELREVISNGRTLCVQCHYKTYSRKSGELLEHRNVKTTAISSQAVMESFTEGSTTIGVRPTIIPGMSARPVREDIVCTA